MTRSLTINDKMYNFEIDSRGGFIGYCNGRMIISGYSSSKDKAVESVENYIAKLTGEVKTVKEEEKVVAPEVKETVVETKTEEPVVEEAEETGTVAEDEVVLRVVTAKNEDGTFAVELHYGTLKYDVEGAVIKYTTNGKDVVSSSKIYKETFTVAEGTVINANAYVNKEIVATLKAYEVK